MSDQLFSLVSDEERDARLTLRLTEKEHRAIERAAKKADLAMADYVRRAIKASIEASA